MRRVVAILFFSFSVSCGFSQHFPIVGQYAFNEMLINSAATGKTNSFNGQIGFRKQWARLKGAPSTLNLSIQSPIKNKNMALGLLLFSDRIGVTTEHGLVLNYAYRIKLNRTMKMAFGLSGGLSLNRTNYAELSVNDQADPSFISNSPTHILPYTGLGFRIESSKYEVGFSIPKLINLSSVDYEPKLKTKFGINLLSYHLRGMYKHQLNRDIELQPNTLVKFNSSSKLQIDFNLYAYYKNLIKGGLGYRTSEGILLFAGYQINKQFSLGGQYEIALGKLASYKSGSFEIVLIYNSLTKSKAKNPRLF